MKTWEDYKNHVKETDSARGQDLAEMEEMASIISAMIQRRMDLGLSQRKLAEVCGLPQSSIARMESFRTTPKLDTLLKVMEPLGMKLEVKFL